MVIPVYKEVPDQEELCAINNAESKYSKKDIFFVCPESMNADVYTVGGYGKETFPDRYFTSERAYSRLLLRPDFYKRFADRGYTHMLITQTDVWMIGNEKDVYTLLREQEEKGDHWSYYGAPWPEGKWVYSRAFKGLSLIKKWFRGRILYVGNGGFSLRNLEDTQRLLKAKRGIAKHWNSGEDVFYAYHGTDNKVGFTVAPAQVAGRLSLEEDAKAAARAGFIPIGMHAWKKYYPDFKEPATEPLIPGDHRRNREEAYPIPIVLFVFNRPVKAEQLAGQVAKIHPQKVYLIADHGRSQVEGEERKVEASVQAVRQYLPQDCRIIEIRADHNMGCDARIRDGLDRVFQKEEMAVILEDDCLPELSFFDYTKELLERYKNEPRVKYIAGSNQVDTMHIRDSYAFTYNAWTWGWATWARAWNEQLPVNEQWQNIRGDIHRIKVIPGKQRRELKKTIDVYAKKGTIPWDYAFGLSVLFHDGLSIVPRTNLIINTGFSEDATHTGSGMEGYHPQTVAMDFPLQHPKDIAEYKGYVSHAYRWHRESVLHKLISPAFYKRFLRRLLKR